MLGVGSFIGHVDPAPPRLGQPRREGITDKLRPGLSFLGGETVKRLGGTFIDPDVDLHLHATMLRTR